MSMPDPDPVDDTPPPDTTRAHMAARLEALLGIPVDYFDGVPGAVTGPGRDLLDVDPLLAVRARRLMATVMHGRTPDLDTALIVVSMPEFTADDVDRAA